MVVFQAVESVLADAGLLGKPILVAVSGGVDSVCLLRALHRISQEGGVRLELAHVDHGLRSGAAADAEFCRSLASDLGIPFHLRRLTPSDFPPGRNLQAEARRHRRAFLAELATGRGLEAVALGHHADDQIETVLFRLLRGTGPRGLGGMVAWDPPFLRPFLGVRKSELLALAQAEGWHHREDPSNQSLRFLRNRVRLELVPVLRSLNPAAEEAVLRLARLAAEDDRFLTELTRKELARLSVHEPEGLRFPACALQELAPAIRRRVYLAAWVAVGCDPAVLSAHHLEAVDDLLGSGRAHRKAPLPGPGTFARSYGDLWILRPSALSPPVVRVELGEPGRRAVPGLGLEAVWGKRPPPGKAGANVPARRGPGPVILRSWKPGDRLILPEDGTVKVKDLLMEARVPAWRRAKALVAESHAGPFALLLEDRVWGSAAPDDGVVWLESVKQSGAEGVDRG